MSQQQEIRELVEEISKHRKNEVIVHCVDILKVLEEKNEFAAFWEIFKVIEWAFKYGFEQPINATEISKNKIAGWFDRIAAIGNNHPLFEEGIDQAMSLFWHQQTPFQIRSNTQDFARQLMLFEYKSVGKYVQKFEEQEKIGLLEYLHLSYINYLYCFKDLLNGNSKSYSSTYEQDYLNILSDKVGRRKVDSFMHIHTMPYSPSPVDEKVDTRISELYNNDFILEHPILHMQKAILPIHRSIFHYNSKYYLYDRMKREFGSNFNSDFGNSVERYIEIGLTDSNADFLKEKELRQRFNKHDSLVDFVINGQILVESKAIEASLLAKRFPSAQTLTNTYKDSIIKAITKQFISTAKLLQSKDQLYGIIVTYKELFLIDGRTAWKTFISSYISQKNIDYSFGLDPDNIFFVDVRTWDLMCLLVKNEVYSFSELIQFVQKRRIEDPQATFEMYIEGLKKDLDLQPLTFLDESLSRIQEVISG